MISLLLTACLALHVLALALWFGALVLGRVLGVGEVPARAAGAPLPRTMVSVVFPGAAPTLALLTGFAWIPLQAASAFDLSPVSRDIPGASLLVLDTGIGRMWLLHLVPVLVGALAVLVRAGAERLVFLLSAAALGSLAFQGHAAAIPGNAGLALRLLTSVHILAGAAWVGSLPSLAALCSRMAPGSIAGVLRAYSRLGAGLVGAVLASGVAIAAVHLGGDARAAVASDYGRWLFVKVALVAAMGYAALRNRNRFTPLLEKGDALQGDAVAVALLRNIRREAAIGMVVVFLAVVLGGTETPG